eukprot:CAMPEP_0204351940 /NCGR_PEP_ID=MMETSP0469-20131031/31500_1 /ASSEMBLY_ACC=CAM_ASM_000384 /TAXON_ID=2969 /ORGANISM="Oxyrrhis marina" /LENGTH=46 /DNA_ID= /DNA_START= /DNA_END= /DNA_ORIENTATION=
MINAASRNYDTHQWKANELTRSEANEATNYSYNLKQPEIMPAQRAD